ncbi:MAG TPA: beta-propeller domain-containing protein, partial [Polyangiaceae bacterium]|nr:beta-propeller domain-containing protein [Polyangiaceae bacterium]
MEHPLLPTSLQSFDGPYDYSRGNRDPVDGTALVRTTDERVYALSMYGWLSVIDSTEPDHLQLRGQAKVKADPFQLHVLGSTAVGLFNDCEEYRDGAQSSGCVVAFDVSEPNGPIVKGGYPIRGKIGGARLTGHILYVVTNDTELRTTSIVALDVAAPTAPLKVDERIFPNATDTASGWAPGVNIAEQRIYVASPRLQDGVAVGTAITVVDTSNPNGKLADVAELEAVGRVEFSWQMDEVGGVLRLLSLPLNKEPTCVQTFSVSPTPLPAPLARLDLNLGGYVVRDVRFDATHAYAVHYQGGYSLAAFDLADPANPKHLGNIKFQGKPQQVVPMGERLITLSRSDISLFDVSGISEPRLLAQAELGEDLSYSSSEDESSFGPIQVFEAEHLIAIPYSVPNYGVRLIDWTDSAFTLAGTVDAEGMAQRIALQADRIFVVSNLSAQSFDIITRQAPRLMSELKLTETASRLLNAGHTLARVSVDGSTVRIETSSPSDIERRQPSGSVDVKLSPAGGEQWNLENVLAGNDRVYVLASESDYTRLPTDPPRETRIITIDVSNAADPRVIDESTFSLGIGWLYHVDYRVPNAREMTALAGNVLVAMGRELLSWNFQDGEVSVRNSLHV